MSETRKIAAALVADVVGYSRFAGEDKDRTLSRVRGLRSGLIRHCRASRAHRQAYRRRKLDRISPARCRPFDIRSIASSLGASPSALKSPPSSRRSEIKRTVPRKLRTGVPPR